MRIMRREDNRIEKEDNAEERREDNRIEKEDNAEERRIRRLSSALIQKMAPQLCLSIERFCH